MYAPTWLFFYVASSFPQTLNLPLGNTPLFALFVNVEILLTLTTITRCYSDLLFRNHLKLSSPANGIRFSSAWVDNHGGIHLISLDISKAFDRVWHGGLLSKLPTFRCFPSPAWYTSIFLSKQTIPVGIVVVRSQPFPVNPGVPQGPVHAPTIFLPFIDDLSTTSNPTYSFAGYSTLHCFLSYHTPSHTNTNIDRDRGVDGVYLNSGLEHISC